MKPMNSLLDEGERSTSKIIFYKLTKDGYEVIELSSRLDIIGVNVIRINFGRICYYCYSKQRNKESESQSDSKDKQAHFTEIYAMFSLSAVFIVSGCLFSCNSAHNILFLF